MGSPPRSRPSDRSDPGAGLITQGSVTLGARRVPVRRRRVRSADGVAEVAVPTYGLFSSTEILARLAMEKMLAKLSTRRYRAGLETVGETVEAAATSTSKS